MTVCLVKLGACASLAQAGRKSGYGSEEKWKLQSACIRWLSVKEEMKLWLCAKEEKNCQKNLDNINLFDASKQTPKPKQTNKTQHFYSFYRKILIVIQCSTFYSKYTITNLA